MITLTIVLVIVLFFSIIAYLLGRKKSNTTEAKPRPAFLGIITVVVPFIVLCGILIAIGEIPQNPDAGVVALKVGLVLEYIFEIIAIFHLRKGRTWAKIALHIVWMPKILWAFVLAVTAQEFSMFIYATLHLLILGGILVYLHTLKVKQFFGV